MYKLDLEKAEELESKLPTSTGSQKKQENSRKTSTSASLTMLKPLTVWITTNCGEFFKKWEYQTTLPYCLLRNLYVGQETTVRTRHGMTDWFQIGKGVHQGFILSPYLFNLHAEYIIRNARRDEAQAGVKIARRNINNLRYTSDTTLIGRKWRGTKEPHDESETGEWKSWLKTQHSKNWNHGIWSHHFMANRWGDSGNSDRLYFLGLQNHYRQLLHQWN